jgi:iron complex outermembrane receptor protein
VVRARTNIVNGGDVSTTGIDFLVQYAHEFDFGLLSTVSVNGTYVLSYDVSDLLVNGIVIQRGFDAVGKLNFQTTAYPIPDFRAQAILQNQWGKHDLQIIGNFVNGYEDTRAPAYRIPSFYTVDIAYNLNLTEDLILNFTVFNIANKQPGFARLDLNYDPFTANPVGRQFSFGVRKTFQ